MVLYERKKSWWQEGWKFSSRTRKDQKEQGPAHTKRLVNQHKPIRDQGLRSANLQKMDLGLWLSLGEARCLRFGNLRRRLEIDKDRIVKIMDSWQATNAIGQGPEGVRAR